MVLFRKLILSWVVIMRCQYAIICLGFISFKLICVYQLCLKTILKILKSASIWILFVHKQKLKLLNICFQSGTKGSFIW